MKKILAVVAVVLACSLMLGACGKKAAVDTAKLQKSFASASAADKAVVDKVAADVKAAKYADAAVPLQTLAAKPALTPEQQTAVKDVISQIQIEMTKAANDAAKAAADKLKGLGK